MRVLHVLEPAIAGVPAYVDLLGLELDRRGVEQHVLTSNEQEWSFDDWTTTSIRREWSRSMPSTIGAGRAIRSLVAAREIDVVHAHASWAGLAARLVPAGAPVVYQPHGWGADSVGSSAAKRVASRVEAALARRTARLLLLSEAEVAAAPTGVTHRKVDPLVDLRRFEAMGVEERAATRSRLGIDSDGPLLVCVGELTERKRQASLAAAWRDRPGDKGRLVFVGDGQARADVESHLDHSSTVLGWRDDVPSIVAAADGVIVASQGEGFSLVIVEALASGTPVHSTPVGGSESIGEDGTVVQDLPKLIAAALAFPPESLSDEARRGRSDRAKARFALRPAIDAIAAVYDEVTRAPRE